MHWRYKILERRRYRRSTDPTRANKGFFFDLDYNPSVGEIYEIGICNGRGEKILDCHIAFTPREKEIHGKRSVGKLVLCQGSA